MDTLFEACMRSKVTCMTCSSSSDSVQKSWLLSLPVSSQAQLNADSNGPKGWTHSQKDAAAMNPASMRDSGKTVKKLTPKAQKARYKGLRKEEKRRRKQEQHEKPSATSISSSGFDGSGVHTALVAVLMQVEHIIQVW